MTSEHVNFFWDIKKGKENVNVLWCSTFGCVFCYDENKFEIQRNKSDQVSLAMMRRKIKIGQFIALMYMEWATDLSTFSSLHVTMEIEICQSIPNEKKKKDWR